jgi:hypothetical protein
VIVPWIGPWLIFGLVCAFIIWWSEIFTNRLYLGWSIVHVLLGPLWVPIAVVMLIVWTAASIANFQLPSPRQIQADREARKLRRAKEIEMVPASAPWVGMRSTKHGKKKR